MNQEDFDRMLSSQEEIMPWACPPIALISTPCVAAIG